MSPTLWTIWPTTPSDSWTRSGLSHAHVVGASMGGMIAQLVAINHPDRAKSLISIMSTTGRRDLPSGKPETLSVLFRPPNSESRDDLIEASMLVQKALAGPGFQ